MTDRDATDSAVDAAHAAAEAAGAAGYDDPGTGLFVFTEAWLRARGHCCGSGCRHCPWSAPGARDRQG